MQIQNGTSFCDTATTYLQSLLARRDYAGVVRYYEDNRSQMTGSGACGTGELHYVAARAYASLTNYSAALKAARTAQAAVSAQGDCLLLAEVFITLGQILRDSGQLTEAQKAYRDAESIFRRNDCPEGQSRALNQLASICFRQADYRNALVILMDAVELARRLDDNRKLAYMMGNIGRLNTFLGDFQEAAKHLRINVDLSTQLGDKLELTRARLSLGYVYLQQGRYADARQEFELAGALTKALNVRAEEIMRLTYLGELEYRSGALQDSRRTLDQALVMAEETDPGSSATARVLRHIAELQLRLGDFRLAQKYAARSLVVMQKVDDKIEIGALNKILAQVAAHEGKAESARSLFKLAMDQLEESGVRWEKAEVMVAAGESRVFSERERMTYLFRAEEFYARCRIDSRLLEVSRKIAHLGEFGLAQSPTSKLPNGVDKEVDYLTVCPAIKRIKGQLPMLAHTDLPVLITGETGVGKDQLARYFHSLVRPEGPYVAINCASVPETLLESELFGYKRGAFTGADGNKKGLFVAAHGGVLLLDEIGDMPLSLQAKLLGVLERRKVMPLGDTTEVSVDILLVAATNRNLEEMVEAGTFRRDLYYRLSGITFELPPLRERKEDVPLLLEHFMGRSGLLKDGRKLPAELVRQFMDYPWPGNVRELSNKVKRLEIMSQLVAEGDLVEVARTVFGADAVAQETSSLFERVEQFERQLITEALLAAGGNKSEAARMLGVHEATVRTKLKRYGLAAADSDSGAVS